MSRIKTQIYNPDVICCSMMRNTLWWHVMSGSAAYPRWHEMSDSAAYPRWHGMSGSAAYPRWHEMSGSAAYPREYTLVVAMASLFQCTVKQAGHMNQELSAKLFLLYMTKEGS